MKPGKLAAVAVLGGVGVVMVAAVATMADRVGDEARFVTWRVVAFTVVAAAAAIVGVWSGLRRPGLLAVGLLAALPVSYFLPAAPLLVIALVLVGLAGLAVRTRGIASGVAAGTGSLMVLLVVLEGPAVECGESSVSSGSGPWWVPSPTSSSGSGSMSGDGVARGTTEVGGRRYSYTCEQGELTRFEETGRARGASARAR